MGMLEWKYYVRPEDPPEICVPRKGPEDTIFTKAMRNAIEWDLSIRKVSGSPLQARADNRRGKHRTELLPPSSNRNQV